MFRRKVQSIRDVLNQALRYDGLETPLQQHRLLDAWGMIAGPTVASYTRHKFIRNQTLFVEITSPTLRYELSMRRSQLVRQLNDAVGAQIITEIRLY